MEKYKIPLLDSKEALKNADEIYNVSLALNGVDGIHSYKYAQAVYNWLKKAANKGGKDAMIQALKDMKEILEKGGTFW